MNKLQISILIGYIVIINIISLGFIWMKVRTKYLEKVSEKASSMIITIFSLIGGFVGTFIGMESFGYKQDSVFLSKWLKVIVFFEVCIIIYQVCTKMLDLDLSLNINFEDIR